MRLALRVGGADHVSRGEQAFSLANEFASVRVRLDTAANSPRVEVTDLASGRRILLDPLELVTLSWCSHRDLVPLVDPARWWAEEDILPLTQE